MSLIYTKIFKTLCIHKGPTGVHGKLIYSSTGDLKNKDGTAYSIFLCAASLAGISAVPLWTTGFAHIESQVRKRTAPLLFGLINMFAGIGSFVGIVGTAMILEIYVDFNRDVAQLTDPTDSSWIGAWWVPFLIASGLALFCSIPMLGFPKQLAGTAKIRMDEEKERETELKDSDFKSSNWQAFYKSEKFFWTDPVIVAQIACEVFEAMVAAGLLAFGIKFMEQMFHLTPSQAGFIAGIIGDNLSAIHVFSGYALV